MAPPIEPTAPPPVDPAIQAASTAPAGDGKPGAQGLDPLQRDDDESALLADPSHPLGALYRQALRGLELLGDPRLKDRKELERVALMIAMRAGANGLHAIERVAPSSDGLGYHFADNRTVDPALRGYVAHAEQGPAPQERAAAEALRARQVQEQRTGEQAHRDAELLRRQDPARR